MAATNRTKLIKTAVAAGVPVAKSLWDTLNTDDRAVAALQGGLDKAKGSASAHTPMGRLERRIETVRTYVRNSDDPRAAQWAEKADRMAARLPLVKVQKGKERRASMRKLGQEADELLAEVLDAQ